MQVTRIIPDVPSFLAGMMTFDTWSILFMVVQALVIFLVVVIVAALMIVYERRMLALWQDRYGPNRVGPFGSLQLVADMLKIFFKEDWTPKFSDKFMFILAPAIAMFTALWRLRLPCLPLWPLLPLFLSRHPLGLLIGISAFCSSLPWQVLQFMR